MVARNFKDPHVTSRSHRSFSKLTAVSLIALTCALAGCGRKAGLDLPPDAPAAAKNQPAPDFATVPGSAGSMTSGTAEVYRPPGSSTTAVAPRGEKKRIPLDAILD
jgi:predicted small lipoprotein YifL